MYFVKFYRILIILVTENNLKREREKIFALLSSEKKKVLLGMKNKGKPLKVPRYRRIREKKRGGKFFEKINCLGKTILLTV